MNSASKKPAGKIDLDWVAAKLNEILKLQPDGSLTFENFGLALLYEDLLTVLETSQQFDAGIPEVERRSIVGDAARGAAARPPITSRSLAGEISRFKEAYRKKSPKDFVLATSLTIEPPADLGRLSFDGVRFAFAARLPRGFSRSGLEFERWARVSEDLPSRFVTVRVRIRARSEFEAFDRAAEGLDYLRGIWNYANNFGTWTSWHSDPTKPVNAIRWGPVHTLHDPAGWLLTDKVWVEPFAHGGDRPENVRKEWPYIRGQERKVRGALERLSAAHRAAMREAFIRYARCLDSTDHESGFLKLWSLLEFLAASTESYEQAIRRVLFLHDEERYHRSVLEHLRLRRNGMVHAGESSAKARTLVYQLLRYVHELIRFHLGSRGRFGSPEEAVQILDLPRDPALLKDRLSRIRYAIKYRK